MRRFRGPNGAVVAFDDPLPRWLVQRMARGEVTELDGEPEASPSGAPPKAGPGSGRDAWAEYAHQVGIEVTDEMDRSAIIDAVEESEPA